MTIASEPYVVRVSAVQADGKHKVTIWSSFVDAMDAEREAARLRSFGWYAYAADLTAERAAKRAAKVRR